MRDRPPRPALALYALSASAGALLALNVAIGLCFGAGRIFGPAVQADAIDDEERRSGERKEGSFFACWNLVEKSGQGGAVVLAGAVLQLSRFEPGAATRRPRCCWRASRARPSPVSAPARRAH